MVLKVNVNDDSPILYRCVSTLFEALAKHNQTLILQIWSAKAWHSNSKHNDHLNVNPPPLANTTLGLQLTTHENTHKTTQQNYFLILTRLHGSSVRRSSLLDWKKDWNWTEPNCKRPDHRLRLHKFWIFSVASCDICRKIEKPKKNRSRPVATRLSSCHVLDLTHAHFSLIVGFWIIKIGQELVEI